MTDPNASVSTPAPVSSVPVTPVGPTPAPVASPRWAAVVGAFAAAIGRDYADVTAALVQHAVNAPDDAGVAILADGASMDNATWGTIFGMVKKPVLNGAVNALRASQAAPAPAAATAPASPFAAFAANAGGMGVMVQLRQVGDDPGFLSSLVAGGKLAANVTANDAACAVRVLMAESVGLFKVPERLVERIEARTQELEVPADGSVFELIDAITTREYAPLLRAMGAPLRAISNKHREEFLSRVKSYLIPGLKRFHAALSGWYETFKAERPNMLLSVLTAGMGAGGMLPEATDTSAVRSAAADLMTMTNKLFGGAYAIPAARALALDAVQIRQNLDDSRFMLAAGYNTRDEMLRGLGIAVTEQFSRTERALWKYIVNAMDIPNIPDQALPIFAQQLYLEGAGVDFDTLGTAAGANSASGNPRREPRTPAKGSTNEFAPFPGYDRNR